MKKSAIEQSITKQAEKRFNEELAALIKFLADSPVAKELRIKVEGNDRPRPLAHKSDYSKDELYIPVINFDEVKEKLIEKYEAEEVKNLESKLDSIRYIFENGGR